MCGLSKAVLQKAAQEGHCHMRAPQVKATHMLCPPAATGPAFAGSVGLLMLLSFRSLPTAETTVLLPGQIEIKVKMISYHVLL